MTYIVSGGALNSTNSTQLRAAWPTRHADDSLRHPDPGVLQPFVHRQFPVGDVRLHRRGVTVDAK